MSFNLKVETAELSSTADALSNEKEVIIELTEKANDLVCRELPEVWQGGAADAYNENFRQLHDDIQNILNIIEEYVQDLRQAAGIYEDAEKEALQDVEGLPIDF